MSSAWRRLAAETYVSASGSGASVDGASGSACEEDVPEPVEVPHQTPWAALACSAHDAGPLVANVAEEAQLAPVTLQNFAPVSKKRGRPSQKLQVFLESRNADNGEALEYSGGGVAERGVNDSEVGVVELVPRVEEHLPHPDRALYMVPDMRRSIVQSAHGHKLLPAISSAFQACVQRCSVEHVDSDYLALFQDFVADGANFHHNSVVVRAEKLGICKSNLEKKVMRLAAGQLLYSKMQRYLLESALVTSMHAGQLLAYVESCSYDETPLKTMVLDAGKMVASLASYHQRHLKASSETLASCSLTLKNDSSSTKILQIRQGFAMVMKLPMGFVKIYGETPCALQAMQKGTSEVLKESLFRVAATSPASEQFALKTRAVSSDQFKGNLRAGTGIHESRGHRWQHLATYCEIHATSRAFHKTFDTNVPEHITGLIRCALSLRVGGAMTSFRQSLREIISERVHIYYGRASDTARMHRHHCLSLFLDGSSNALLHRYLLSALPNGDWRCTSEVQVFLPIDMQHKVVKKDLVATLTDGLLMALTSRKPALFVRHRWSGCDQAVNELAILEACHGLLSACYAKFLQKLTRKGGSTASASSSKPANEEYPNSNQALSMDMPWTLPNVDDARPVPEVPHDHPDEPAQAQDVMEQCERSRSAAENAKDKQYADQWLQSSPFSFLVLIRLSMQPLLELFNKQFLVSSEGWEREQQALAAQARMTSQTRPARQWMMTVAAQHILEDGYFKKLQHIFLDSPIWTLVAEKDITVSLNALAFRLLAKQGSLIYEDIMRPHKRFPYKLFTLLHNPEKAALLAAEKECLLDNFSKALLHKYPGYDGEELLQVLEAHAQKCSTSTSGIEARHGSIRRVLLTRSAQTHTMPFADLSAEWLLTQLRRAKLLSKPMTASAKIRAKKRKAEHKNNANCGGLWRAWVRHHSIGQQGRCDLHELALGLQAAKASKNPLLVHLTRLGQMARTVVKATGMSSHFGYKSQDLQRKRKKSDRYAFWKRTGAMDPVQKAILLADKDLYTDGLAKALSCCRTMSRWDGAEKRRANGEIQKLLDTFAVNSKDSVEQFRAAYPEVANLVADLQPFPTSTGMSFVVPASGSLQACKATSFAACSHASNVAMALEKDWMELHSMVTTDMCQPIVVDGGSDSPCWKAGMCICKGSTGFSTHALLKEVVKQLKTHFKTKAMRSDLAKGNVVIQFKGKASLDIASEQILEFWFNIASMSFSPYKASYLQLDRVMEPPIGYMHLAGKVAVKACFGKLKYMNTIIASCVQS
eukprot:6492445-Amphidinium_carterae.1